MSTQRPSAGHEKLVAKLDPGLRSLARRGVIRSYRKNAILVNEGEFGDSLFVLLQGRVKAYSTGDGDREITYYTVEAGDYFAEMWLDGGPRCASIMTLEPSVGSLVGRRALRDHHAEEPEFAVALMAQVIRRARAATQTARILALLV